MEFPEIPGYKITRRLGQGGMATVFLAEPTNFVRNVALKVMSTQLHQDEHFAKRFMREARTMAQMSHQHIVQVFDIGEAGLHHYIAMEYLPGGDLKQKLRRGIELNDGIRIIKEIAGALTYAASKNFVHRDIKPDNILFREDGSSVVSDFGIARDTEATQLTSVGTIMGSPHYMSPEQAKGMELDGRSDLYSLGIIVYEMLTGSVPFDGDSAVSIGVQHVSEAPPALPVDMQDFQPFIDKALAKNPDERFQTGQEMIDELDDLLYELSDQASETVLMSQGDWAQASSRHKKRRSIRASVMRIKPTTAGAAKTSAAAPQYTGRVFPLGVKTVAYSLLALATAASTVWWLSGAGNNNQQPLYAEQSSGVGRSEQLNNKATQAIEEDRLLSPENDNAFYYLTTVLTLWPSDKLAIKNISKLFEMILSNADEAIAQGAFEKAKTLLNQASQITFYVDNNTLKNKQQELNKILFEQQQKNILHSERLVQVEALLEKAATHIKTGQLTSPAGENAFDLYQQVLSLDPESKLAVQGLEKVAAAFLDKATAANNTDQFDRARAFVSAAVQIYPEHKQIKKIRSSVKAKERAFKLAQLEGAKRAEFEAQEKRAKQLAQAKRAKEIANLLQGATKNMKAQAYHAPDDNNAIEKYKKILVLEAENQAALAGLTTVANKYIMLAQRAILAQKMDEANDYLSRARKLTPQSKLLLTVQKQWRSAKDKQLQAEQLAKVKRDSIKQLLFEAEQHIRAGQIYKPKNNNGLQKFDKVLEIDSSNQRALSGRAELLKITNQDAVKYIQANDVAGAQFSIDALIHYKASKRVVSTLQAQLETLLKNSLSAQQQQQALENERLLQETLALEKRREEEKIKAARLAKQQLRRTRQRESNAFLTEAEQLIAVPYKKPGLFGDNDKALATLRKAYQNVQKAREVDRSNPTIQTTLSSLNRKYKKIVQQLFDKNDLQEAEKFITLMPSDKVMLATKSNLQKQLVSLKQKKKTKRKVSIGGF